jgi:1,2-diacylglycerol 3-alpha-glucosyltransferase
MKYRVAMVAACPFPGNWGTPGAIREMSQTLAGLGYNINVVTYPFGEDLPVGEVKIWRPRYRRRKHRLLHSGPSLEKLLLDLLLTFELCRVIRRERIQIIHAHNYEGVLVGIIAKLFSGTKLIYNASNLMADELPSYGFIRPAFAAKALARLLDWIVPKFPDHFIAVSKQLSDALGARGIPDSRISLIPCGISPEMFANPNPERLRARFNLGDRAVVMYTGINSPLQRIDYLLRSFALVLQQEPSAILMVVSPLENDPDLERNRSLSRTLGISDSVIWVEGHTLAELSDYLDLAAMTVIPRPDVPGHPIKLLNSMAAGKPTVCFAGAAKGVEHMRDAFLVADHDWPQLGNAIVTVLRDPVLASRLGSNARKTAFENFTWRQLCAKIESTYEAVMHPPSTAPRQPEISATASEPSPVEAERLHSSSVTEGVTEISR